MNYSARTTVRSGQVAPLTALMLIPLLGMIAFSADVGYLVVTRTQLQNPADAAAIAGAQQLMNPSIEYVTPGNSGRQATILSSAITSAIATAKAVAERNYAGGVSIVLLDADVDVGYTAPNGTYTSTSGTLPAGAFPNTVKVTARRDTTQNAEVNTFFGKLFGKGSVPMEARAAATNYTVTLDGPTAPPVYVLPMTFDRLMYQQFINSGTLPNNDLLTDVNGERAIQLYPSIQDKGNFGILSLNDSSNNANDIRSWIQNGLVQADVDALSNGNLIPLTSHNSLSWDWSGSPGFKASNVADLNQVYIPGQSYLLPLFTPSVPWIPLLNGAGYEAGVGQGQNYDYNISGFASVTIESDPTDNRVVIVKPSAAILDYTKILTASSPSVGGQPGATIGSSIFLAPRLTE